jgi:hypothetical protein
MPRLMPRTLRDTVNALGSRPALAGTVKGMSGEREELRRLVEELPDEHVDIALAVMRRMVPTRDAGAWPPTWMNSFSSGGSDVSRRHEDLLAYGFGRQ